MQASPTWCEKHVSKTDKEPILHYQEQLIKDQNEQNKKPDVVERWFFRKRLNILFNDDGSIIKKDLSFDTNFMSLFILFYF